MTPEELRRMLLGRDRYATPDQLSPKAREIYETARDREGEDSARTWLRYGDHYVMDDDMNAVEVPFVEWAVYTEEHRDERQIRRDILGEWLISTVFLGLDHGFRHGFRRFDRPEGYKPVLWETMIFHEPMLHRPFRFPKIQYGKGNWSGVPRIKAAAFPADCQWRYTSTREAIAGHERAVQLVQLVRKGPRKAKKFLRRYRWDTRKVPAMTRRYRGLLTRFEL